MKNKEFIPNKRKSIKGLMTLSPEEIQKISNENFYCRYLFLGLMESKKYTGVFECREHSVVFTQLLSSHLKGAVTVDCPDCFREHHRYVCRTRKKSISIAPHKAADVEIQKRFDKAFDGRIKFLNRDPHDYRYGIFKCIHNVPLRTTIQKRSKICFPMGCTECTKEVKNPKTKSLIENVRKRVSKVNNGKFFLMRRDSENSRYGHFYCREHGIEFKQLITKNLLGQRSCKLCLKESNYAREVKEFLFEKFNKNSIELEKTFEDCLNIFPLRFDFYIPECNLLIEVDGEQHFYPMTHWGGDNGFVTRVENDGKKDSYCLEKSINLIRIGFYEISNAKEIINYSLDEIKAGKRIYRIHQNRIPQN